MDQTPPQDGTQPAPAPQPAPTPAPAPAPQAAAAAPIKEGKNKVAAGVLAILLGGIGVHKFYLGNIAQGILYALFFWTGIPAIVGLIEGILYLTMSDAAFDAKYNVKAA